MLPVAEIHKLTAALSPHAVSAAALMLGTLLTLVFAWWRRPKMLRRAWPAIVFVLAGAAALWPLSREHLAPWPQYAATGVAGIALIVEVTRRRRDPSEPSCAGDLSTPTASRCRTAALFLATVLLFDNLGDYAGQMVVWEAPVVEGFAEAFIGGQRVPTYAAERLLWDAGVLSGGHTSLFYGAPTYALFHVAGFTPWNLRVFAAIATLLSIAVIYAFGRRFFCPMIGAAVAVLFLINPAVIFYGRYGSSPAGTILAVLLAAYATWSFLDATGTAWWTAVPCAAALYVATLQYSPARLVVVILLAFIVLTTVVQWRQLGWSRAFGLAVIIVAALGVWHLEGAFQRRGAFLSARGEQYFAQLESPGTIEGLLGHKLRNNPRTAADVMLADKIELLRHTLQTTIPQYTRLLAPNLEETGGAMFQQDPPPLPLYDPPAALFIAWGFLLSVSRWRSWKHQCLLMWVAATTVALLLTNRVDAHRIILFIIPLSLWGAMGVREAALLMGRAAVPALVQHVLTGILILAGVLNNVSLLYLAQPPEPKASLAILDEIMRIPGAVQLGSDGDGRGVALIQLGMLERMRHDLRWQGKLLYRGLVDNVVNTAGRAPSEPYLRDLQREAEHSTILLAPANNFRKAAASMQARGLRVAERTADGMRFIRIDSGAAITGVPDADVSPLPIIAVPPTPTPIPLRGGPQVPLADLDPLNVQFGSQAPKTRRNGNGPPVLLGGVSYPDGLVTHAWTKMTYAVPAGAKELQAIVGIDDGVRECTRASVTFEVRGPDYALLYDSGLVDPSTPALPIRVDLHGATQITLAVTDGGNGIECDHADWALPSFLLPE